MDIGVQNTLLGAPILPDVVALIPTARGAALASRIASDLAAVPTAISSEADVEALIRLCAQDSVSREAKLALLDVLRKGDHKPPSDVKRELQTLRESLDQDVKVAALVYLARQKDRAHLHYLIGDHNSAVRDWRDALKAQEERPGLRTSAPFLGLARSLALLGKFKEAAEYLDKAPMLSLTALHELADDPDFAEMRTTKYADVFRLDKDETAPR